MAPTDFLLIVKPFLVPLAGDEIADPLHKALLDRGLVIFVRLAVRSEEPFREIRLLGDDRAPAVDQRLFLSGQYLGRHRQCFGIRIGPADRLLQCFQFVAANGGTGGLRRAVVVAGNLRDVVHLMSPSTTPDRSRGTSPPSRNVSVSR